MWLCLNNAFISIVDKAKMPGCLMVRARRKSDITRIFPEADVIANKGTDYRYRAEIQREQVAQAVAKNIMEIDYPNFKNSVNDQDLHDAYMNVWDAMNRLQR